MLCKITSLGIFKNSKLAIKLKGQKNILPKIEWEKKTWDEKNPTETTTEPKYVPFIINQNMNKY